MSRFFIFTRSCSAIMLKKSKLLLLAFLFPLASQPLLAQLTGDNYPVQSHVYINGAGTRKLSELFTSSTKLNVDLILKDLTKTTLPVYLEWQLEGIGLGVQVRSTPGFIPSQNIQLQKGRINSLKGIDLREYFQPGTVDVAGVAEGAVFNGSLPEGFYVFRVRAYEAGTGRTVSNLAETYFSIAFALPPIINLPFEGSEVTVTRPQNVPIQWTPRHTRTPSSNVVYHLTVCPVAEDEEPYAAMNSRADCFEMPAQTTTTYNLRAADLPLQMGQRYAVQVRAEDLNQSLEFQNEGYSETTWFRYGKQCTAPERLTVNEVGPGRVNVSWQANEQALGYKLEYRPENETDWNALTTLGTSSNIYDLKPDETYLFRVATTCAVGYDSPVSEEETYEVYGIDPEDEELDDLIYDVLNPLKKRVSTTDEPETTDDDDALLTDPSSVKPTDDPTVLTLTDPLDPNAPLPTKLADLLDDPTKIPCSGSISTYENCDVATEVDGPTGTDFLDALNVGDYLTVADYAVVITEVGVSNPLSGKGLARLPFMNDVFVGVEFSGVSAIKDETKPGGCVNNVPPNGFFRVRNLTQAELEAEEQTLINTIRESIDPESTLKTLDELVTDYTETGTEIKTKVANGDPVTEAEKDKLLKENTLLITGLTGWQDDVNELTDGLEGVEINQIRADIQALLDELEENKNTIATGGGYPVKEDVREKVNEITAAIKRLLENQEPEDPQISNVIAKNITDNSATISWKGDPRFTRYVVTYQKPGEGEVTRIVTNPEVELTGLGALSTYNIKIKGISDGYNINEVSKSFTTLLTSFPPIKNIRVSDIDDFSKKIRWKRENEHVSYEIEYFDDNGVKRKIIASKNTVDITQISTLGGFATIRAFSKDKSKSTVGSIRLNNEILTLNDGVLEVLNIEGVSDECIYSGNCMFTFTCPDAFGITAIGTTTPVDPYTGNCQEPAPKYGCQYPAIFTGYQNLSYDCEVELPPIIIPIPPLNPLDSNPFDEICLEDNNVTESNFFSEGAIGQIENNLIVQSPPIDLGCFFNYDQCVSDCKRDFFIRHPEKQADCPRALVGCAIKCAAKSWMWLIPCRKDKGKIKPQPQTDGEDEEEDKEKIYDDDVESGITDDPSESEKVEMVIIPIITRVGAKPSCEASLTAKAREIPKCYFEKLAVRSPGYEDFDMVSLGTDNTYSSVKTKMAPNGDIYYFQDGVKYWKIAGKYTIAQTPDSNWLVFDFKSGKWCNFSPKETTIEVEQEAICSNTGSIKLSTNGTLPVIFKVEINGVVTEYPSNSRQMVISNLAAGLALISVIDANECSSEVVEEEITPINSLSLSISPLEDCYSTVYLSGVCGTEPYQYSINGVDFSTENKFSNLQTKLILERLDSYEYTFWLRDATGATVSEKLTVEKVDYMVKLKDKDGIIRSMPSERWANFPNRWKRDRGYVEIERYEENGLINISTTYSGCKPGGIIIEAPYAKTPMTVTLTSNNGTTITKTINSKNYIFPDLPNGIYTISGKEKGGCTLVSSSTETNEIEVKSDQFDFTMEEVSRACTNANAVVSMTISNLRDSDDFTNPYYQFQYSVYVDDKLNSSFNSNRSTITRQIEVSPGDHTIRVKETTQGCEASKPFTVSYIAPLTASAKAYPDVCSPTGPTTTLYITPDGGTPGYTYSLSSATETITGNTNIFPNLPNVSYTGNVKDKNGCIATFTYTPTNPPTLSVTPQDPNCLSNGSITLNVTDGTAPYQYSMDDGTTWQGSSTLDGLCAGTYGPFKVKDANDCEATAAAVTLTAPDFLEAETSSITAVALKALRVTTSPTYLEPTSPSGIKTRINISVPFERLGSDNKIKIGADNYTAYFLQCNGEFLGYYKDNCIENTENCTPTYKSSPCADGKSVRIGFGIEGYDLCQECKLNETSKSFEPYILVKSLRRKGLKEGSTTELAADMTFCDMTDQEIIDLNIGCVLELGPLFNENKLFEVWESMSVLYASQGLLEDNIKQMIAKVRRNEGGEYSNTALTEAAKKHSKTREFIEKIKTNLSLNLQSNKDFVFSKNELNEILRPVFADPLNIDNWLPDGLSIAVNDTWGYDVTIVDYIETDAGFQATIEVEIFDHFGLDPPDIDPRIKPTFAVFSGFRSWFVLQHSKKYCFKPFITVMKFKETIKGGF